MSIDDTSREKYDVTHQAHEATACGEAETLFALLRENDILSCVTEVPLHFRTMSILLAYFRNCGITPNGRVCGTVGWVESASYRSSE